MYSKWLVVYKDASKRVRAWAVASSVDLATKEATRELEAYIEAHPLTKNDIFEGEAVRIVTDDEHPVNAGTWGLSPAEDPT